MRKHGLIRCDDTRTRTGHGKIAEIVGTVASLLCIGVIVVEFVTMMSIPCINILAVLLAVITVGTLCAAFVSKWCSQ